MRRAEQLIMTIVQGVSGFSTANTAWGKWGLLNKGKSDHYVIGKPGPVSRRRASPLSHFEAHSTILQVWQRYKDDGRSLEDLETRVDALIAAIDTQPRLGDETETIQRVILSRASEAQEMWKRSGGPAWLKIDLTVEWEVTKEREA